MWNIFLATNLFGNLADPKPLSPPTPASAAKRTPGEKRVNKRNEKGESALHIAAIRGDLKQAKKLIKAGADVNVTDFAGMRKIIQIWNF